MCKKVVLFLLFYLFPMQAIARDYSSWIENCDEYRDTVEALLNEQNVETDYFYLMVAESRCTLGAESEKGAQGFWQMLPATGKHYGCHDLHNVECATRAAIKYIKHLKETFKSFRDVIYAYNMGGHNYRRIGATGEAIGLYNRIMEIKRHDNQ
jgi:membrane-bound lytic murein transglycosylase MltF